MLDATRQPYRDYMSIATLVRRAGSHAADLATVAAKEIIDNAHDASPTHGITVKLGETSVRIRDFGPGLSERKTLELFSLKRDALSSKRWRQARRGALGNGLRVVMGVAVCSGGHITVESGGQSWRLAVAPDGSTRIAEHGVSEVDLGTAVTLTVGPLLEFDEEAIADYADACQLARGVAFGGSKAVPQWFGRSSIVELLRDVAPTVSALEFARQFDLTPDALADIKRIAMRATVYDLLDGGPLDDVVAAILAGGKPPRELHRIGRNAIAAEGYSHTEWGVRHTDGATMPLLIECWANATPVRERKTSGRLSVSRLFVNRVPALTLSTSWGTVEPGDMEVTLHIGNAWVTIPAEQSGLKGPCGYDLTLALTSPEFVFLSEGKAPDLSGLGDALADALAPALKRAYRPPLKTLAESYELLREPKPPREPRRPREPKLEPPPHVPGPLGRIHAALAGSCGRAPDTLRVMSVSFDPYTLDTRPNRARAEWLATIMMRPGLAGRRFHTRGLFYALVSDPSIRREDGTPFHNTHANWRYLQDTARFARWLGTVPFDRITDERNTPPVIRFAASRHFRFRSGVVAVAGRATLPMPGALAAHCDGFPARRQPFHLVLLGEKTGLEPVLGPLADHYEADLYLPSGEPSITMLHDLAMMAATDRRPLIVFTFTDFDPTGNNIPVTTARRLQAFRDLLYPDLEFEVRPVAMTEEQVRTLGLPSTPLKASEARAPEWRARYPDLEQTEIDALSTLQPDVLTAIAEGAIAPFFDASLAERQAEAEAAWRRRAEAATATAVADDDTLQPIRARMAELRRAMEAAHDRYNRAVAEFEAAGDAIAQGIRLPAFRTPKPVTEANTAPPPLVSTAMDRLAFVDALRARMIRKKGKDGDEGEEDETGEIDETGPW